MIRVPTVIGESDPRLTSPSPASPAPFETRKLLRALSCLKIKHTMFYSRKATKPVTIRRPSVSTTPTVEPPSPQPESNFSCYAQALQHHKRFRPNLWLQNLSRTLPSNATIIMTRSCRALRKIRQNTYASGWYVIWITFSLPPPFPLLFISLPIQYS